MISVESSVGGFHTLSSSPIQYLMPIPDSDTWFQYDVETFDVAHAIATDDAVFQAEANQTFEALSVAMDANNDDMAGINLAEKIGLRLTEGSIETDSITIASLNSQPVHDVRIMKIMWKRLPTCK